MRISFFLVIILFCYKCDAQKQIIDTTVYGKWTSLRDAAISNDGQFAMYTLYNKPLGSSSVVIESIDRIWKETFTNASEIGFSENNKFAIILLQTDSLIFVNLKTKVLRSVSNIKNYKLPFKDKVFIAYQKNDKTGDLTLLNLNSGNENIFNDIMDYQFDNIGNTLIFQREDKEGVRQLFWLDLLNNKLYNFWQGNYSCNYAFDNYGQQLAFFSSKNVDSLSSYKLMFYKPGNKEAITVVSNENLIQSDSFQLANESPYFNNNGKRLFFTIKKRSFNEPIKIAGYAEVNIWNYKDEYLQSEQLSENFGQKQKSTYKCVYNFSSKKVFRLENEEIRINAEKTNINYVLGFIRGKPNGYYIKENQGSMLLISLDDNSKKLLSNHSEIITNSNSLSPSEKFVVWFDADKLAYFSYETSSDKVRNISKEIKVSLYDDEAFKVGRRIPFGSPWGVVCWQADDSAVTLYDRYDIWEVGLKERVRPINITNGYGRKHEITFSLLNIKHLNRSESWNLKDSLLIVGYDRKSKQNGFWKICALTNPDPQKLTMGSYVYAIPRIYLSDQIDVFYPKGQEPLKAKNSEQYIVFRMNAKSPTNLFTTSDFKSFEALTDLQPQQQYNWIKSDLIHWKMTDGKTSQGILYRPENFDSTKKYPLIFNYYGKRSDEFNEYLYPDYARAEFDIPTFVSHGYLVFVPDIYYSPGHNGDGVVNSIVSAGRFLFKFSWIDSTKIGLKGHSFGGWETFYLITHSNLFTAACGSAGVCDAISSYGQINLGSGDGRQYLYERSAQGSSYGIGVTPWNNSNLYINNSPIFKIGNVKTPLLMMHCKDDKSVPFAQAIEMFSGLRRAGKKVWLLEYSGEGHALFKNENAKDYTIRLQQFFDCYLKNMPPPKWMRIGIPAKMKGYETGYDL